MTQTMRRLQDLGYYVELVQIDDDDPGAFAGLPFPVVTPAQGELATRKITSWPVLLIGDLKKKAVYRLDGYQTVENVLSALRRSGA